MTPEWPLTARSRVQYHPKTSSEGVKEQVVRGPGVRLRKRKRTDEACCQGGVLAMPPPQTALATAWSPTQLWAETKQGFSGILRPLGVMGKE